MCSLSMSSGNVKRKSNDSRVGSPAKRNRPVNQDKEWNQKFFELMVYRAEHGNILVKDSDENHKSLYKWITQQRKDYRRFTENPEGCILNNDRIKVLKSVNFTFGTRNDKNWLYHFDQLKQFKEKYGHTLVPRESEFHGLGGWVVKQRMQQGLTNDDNESEMSQDRKDMLDSLGFVWQVRDRPGWDSRYEELVEFKKQHGHTKVPQHYRENKSLGKWVSKQRAEYKKMKDFKDSLMTPDRIQRLEEIGFAWHGKERSEDIELDF